MPDNGWEEHKLAVLGKLDSHTGEIIAMRSTITDLRIEVARLKWAAVGVISLQATIVVQLLRMM